MDKVLADALRGEALESLKLNSGYKVLIDEIIYPLYEEAWIALKEKEDTQARATLLAIESIVSKIDDQINLGKQARQEYRDLLAKHSATS